MTNLFGTISNQPQRVAEALEPVRSALVTGAPIARWGLAYVQSGEVLLSRNPRTSEEPVDFFAELSRINTSKSASDYIIGHASAADGLRGNANTQPFRFRRWMFAMEGAVDGFADVAPSLVEHVPDYLRRNIRGKTAAEHIFHVFLSFLHDSGRLDDPNLETEQSRRALRDALALVLGAFTKTGITARLGNAVVSNGRSMLAVRMDGPLYMRRLKVPVSQRDPETFKGVLALSASEDPGEGFEEIPARSVLAIKRDILTNINGLDD